MRKSSILGVVAIVLILQGCATTQSNKPYTCREYYEKLATLEGNNAQYFPNQENPCDSLDPSAPLPPDAALYGVNYYPASR